MFDDSFEHEAWHDGLATRIILIVDFWHPDLSDQEVKFLSLIQKAQLKYEKTLSEKNKDTETFFTVISQSKELLKDNNWWAVDNEQYKVVND